MNINEIARLADVSRTTVSRFLNDGYVSAEKRDRIQKVIDETGYVPSSRAQTLRTGRTHLVGVIIPKINSEAIGREVAGITSTLDEARYSTLLANTDNDEHAEVSFLHVLDEKQVDGIILIGTIFTGEHLKAMKELSVPVVVLGQRLERHSCVFFDDYNSMLDLAAHVMGTARHPAFLGVTDRDKAAGHMRRQAFLDAAHAAGIDVPDDMLVDVDFSMESGRDGTVRLMDAHPECDAIVCATDNIAAGCMVTLHERGIDIPGKVAVTGMGDGMLSQVMTPPLSTAHLFYRTSGSEAARMLVSMMRGEAEVRREVKMGYELVLRESTR